MKRIHYTGALGAALVCSLLALNVSFAAVVDVDVAAKSAKSDSPSVTDLFVRTTGDCAGVFGRSTTLTPQSITIRFKGLKDQDYDVYTNGTYTGVKSGNELGAGLKHEIPGRVVPEDLMRCATSVQARVEAEYARLQKMEGADPWRAGYTYGQARTWARTSIQVDANYRSFEIKIVPAGKPLQRLVFAVRMDAEGTVSTAVNVCHKFQMARATMYDGLKDLILRNEVVANLTPVDLSASFTRKNGKLHVTAALVNNCNLPISGTAVVTPPNGWKASTKPAAFKDLKSGKTFKTAFDLAPSAKATRAPASIPVAASVSIAEGRFAAKFTLSSDAKSAAKAN